MFYVFFEFEILGLILILIHVKFNESFRTIMGIIHMSNYCSLLDPNVVALSL